MYRNSNVIPPITEPMGKYWKQPDPSKILIDDTHAVMDEKTFLMLHDYSYSNPTGVYPGKMWRYGRPTVGGERWWLKWYGQVEDTTVCSDNSREILIA